VDGTGWWPRGCFASRLVHIYVHVPFCARRCSYCDFAIAVRREVPSDAFASALLAEWAGWQSHAWWADSPRIASIYFGGGTPSRLASAALTAILDRIRADRPVDADAELTLEANPDDVTPESAAAWAAAGINRVSLGAQSFSPPALEWMHRTHSAAQIAVAAQTLQRAGLLNWSLDLIYALPASIPRSWPGDLAQALALGPKHLSLYGLTVERGTPLGRWTARGESLPAPEERAATEFLLAHQLLAERGFEHYEVSNAALPGHRARHNSAYWHRRPFIGLGPSAHSAMGRFAAGTCENGRTTAGGAKPAARSGRRPKPCPQTRLPSRSFTWACVPGKGFPRHGFRWRIPGAGKRPAGPSRAGTISRLRPRVGSGSMRWWPA